MMFQLDLGLGVWLGCDITVRILKRGIRYQCQQVLLQYRKQLCTTHAAIRSFTAIAF